MSKTRSVRKGCTPDGNSSVDSYDGRNGQLTEGVIAKQISPRSINGKTGMTPPARSIGQPPVPRVISSLQATTHKERQNPTLTPALHRHWYAPTVTSRD